MSATTGFGWQSATTTSATPLNNSSSYAGPNATGTAAATTPGRMNLYVVQKCWFDGPHYEAPIDCLRLWTTADAATQFAHASATQYSHMVAQGRQQRGIGDGQPRPVRTLLLSQQQQHQLHQQQQGIAITTSSQSTQSQQLYGFATSGRLFWVRSVSIPACPCVTQQQQQESLTPLATSTALVRLHQGVMGGGSTSTTAAAVSTNTVRLSTTTTMGNHGRRGTEDVTHCAHLDCPTSQCNLLQTWLHQQLAQYQACTWRRIPVGNNQLSSLSPRNAPSSFSSSSSAEWWKEWSDWESWGNPMASNTGSSNVDHTRMMMMMAVASNDESGRSKRRMHCLEPACHHDAAAVAGDVRMDHSNDTDDDGMDGLNGHHATNSGGAGAWWGGGGYFANQPNKRAATAPRF